MPSRLLQRIRRPDATPEGLGTDDVPLELPPYEPPSYPMDDKMKQKIASMYNSRETDSSRRQYEKHLAKSSNYLSESVGSINDVLYARKRSLARMAEKRRAAGQEKDESEVTREEYVAELDAAITDLTGSSEEALRWVIDCRAELEDHQIVLEQVLAGLNAQQPRPEPPAQKPRVAASRRRVVGSDDEDGDQAIGDAAEEAGQDEAAGETDGAADAPPLVGVKELLEMARKTKMDEYDALNAHQRYAVNNDYIAFKRNWHDALHPEDQVPLPDPSTWFDEHGRPTKDVAAGANEDDDLVVAREIIDLKCPLSLQMFKEPYSNHLCVHTFEKSAIMEFIRSNGGAAKCPVCSKELRIKDLYLDEVVLRKVKRAQQATRRGVDDTSDIEPDEEGDASVVIGRTANIKKENDRSRRRMEEIDDE